MGRVTSNNSQPTQDMDEATKSPQSDSSAPSGRLHPLVRWAFRWTTSSDIDWCWNIWYPLPFIEIQWARGCSTLLSWHGPQFIVTIGWLCVSAAVTVQKERYETPANDKSSATATTAGAERKGDNGKS